MKVAVINGPNLNFLGVREPDIYGYTTLSELELDLQKYSKSKYDTELVFFQSNHEGAIIDFIQACYHNKVEGIIINPGALTHYSYALTDAIKSVSIPTIEVHISNIHAREEFRRHSVTSTSCIGIIGGFGLDSYYIALDGLMRRLTN